uniref:Uncharacterized protein n=1 Tax=Octactis speculum TaxID=3111310 RepID=A0A7S2FLK0_9STRA|mmetsp:Transcript_24011/g.32821  ORF Transcript_24011/g.32821 Transcript_24011/m.32821 type:complete len:125 (+) Transcript_24011:424-798(+)
MPRCSYIAQPNNHLDLVKPRPLPINQSMGDKLACTRSDHPTQKLSILVTFDPKQRRHATSPLEDDAMTPLNQPIASGPIARSCFYNNIMLTSNHFELGERLIIIFLQIFTPDQFESTPHTSPTA